MSLHSRELSSHAECLTRLQPTAPPGQGFASILASSVFTGSKALLSGAVAELVLVISSAS
jgi:hypothetical protein